jgi:hypothetical protein
LGVLLRHLPADGALSQQVNGPVAAWSQTHELLAAILDTLRAGNWQRSGGKGTRPKPMRRPGRDNRYRLGTAVGIAEMRQILDNWSNN